MNAVVCEQRILQNSVSNTRSAAEVVESKPPSAGVGHRIAMAGDVDRARF
jgi:hypothetical protein